MENRKDSKDERVPVLLREIRQLTFLTIDAGFWDRTLTDAKYCILYFPLAHEQQRELHMRFCARCALSND